jgi:hypothetical protein
MKTRQFRISLAGLLLAGMALLAPLRMARAGLAADGSRNAATVGDGIVFDRLNVKPGVGNGGPFIKTVRLPDGEDGQLVVHGDVLYATESPLARRMRSGADLRGMVITLGMPDGREYELMLQRAGGIPIEGSSELPRTTPFRFYVSPNDVVQDYDFVVRKTMQKNGNRWPACSIEPNDSCPRQNFEEHLCTNPVVTQDRLWTDYKSAIVFEGDFFDQRKTARVLKKQDDGWFYLACDGTAAAKMHLLRHTSAGTYASGPSQASDARETSLDQRTAMLKAITADYCGDGNSWTGDGTPLYWTDARGWFPSQVQARAELFTQVRSGAWDVEAIWGPGGALCLNNPRRRPKNSFIQSLRTAGVCPPNGLSRAPAVLRAEVDPACHKSIPTCTKEDIDSWIAAHGGPFTKTTTEDGTRVESTIVASGYVMTVNDPTNPANYCRDPERYPLVPYTAP